MVFFDLLLVSCQCFLAHLAQGRIRCCRVIHDTPGVHAVFLDRSFVHGIARNVVRAAGRKDPPALGRGAQPVTVYHVHKIIRDAAGALEIEHVHAILHGLCRGVRNIGRVIQIERDLVVGFNIPRPEITVIVVCPAAVDGIPADGNIRAILGKILLDIPLNVYRAGVKNGERRGELLSSQ